jgi:L-arabinose isomerase
MKALEELEIWLVAGSQELYGADVLRRVEEHAREIGSSLDAEEDVPCTSC